MGDKTLVMVKGPSHLGANLRLITCHLRFLTSSQTLYISFAEGSETLTGVWGHDYLASSWVASASLWAGDSCWRWVSIAGSCVLVGPWEGQRVCSLSWGKLVISWWWSGDSDCGWIWHGKCFLTRWWDCSHRRFWGGFNFLINLFCLSISCGW